LPNTQSRSDRNFSIEAGAQYQIDATKMIYVRYAEGYRGGGFIGFPSSLAQAAGGYGPEMSRSYEAGLRAEFFDRRLLFNLTVYSATFNDLQRSESKPSPTGFIILTDNIATARTQGVEVEANVRPVTGLNLRGNLSYLKAKYLDYVSGGVDLSATRFSYAPTWSLSFSPSYEFPISTGGLFERVRVQGQWEYRSTYLAAAQDIPQNTQPGFSTFDAQISLMGGHGTNYTVTLYVQNIADERYLTYGVYVPPLLFQQFDDRGRRFGVSLDLNF
jgi:iron complex outermembrane receptor protein